MTKMKRLQSVPQAILLVLAQNSAATAEPCVAPIRPYVPDDAAAVVEFGNLIRRDFEDYIHNVQFYFHCLDTERGRAFEEARQVSQQYGAFSQRAGDN
ncbi:MAG: hypothetical protein ABJO09_20795 [Hyphomicrobiales bacterium]|uniref:hypothetical protein n=2 Tax=Pseudomonadota TaxID=1224 RepID=UPI0032769B41